MNVLSEDNVFSYLVEKGFCEGDRLPLEVLPLPGKNLNFRVKFADSIDWIIKQETHDQHGCNELFLGEWAVQDLIDRTPRLAALRTFIPPVAHYDRENAILVSHFLVNHDNLWSYYDSLDCPFDATIAHRLGSHLGKLHHLTFQQTLDRDHLKAIDPDLIPSHCPSDFAPVERFIPEMWGWIRNDSIPFFKWYQNQPELQTALETLEQTWQASCLTHQDLQFGNCLFNPETRSIQLIDWEKVCWGDPSTDIANLFGTYLHLWLESLPPPHHGNWKQRCSDATIPLATIQPSLIAVIEGYFESFPLEQSQMKLSQILQWAGRYLIHKVETHIQYHRLIGSSEANFLHFAQQLILHPDLLLPMLLDRTSMDSI